MKILHINKFFCKMGGAENIMLQEAEMLEKAGHEVFFFATDRQPYFIENYKLSKFFPKYIPFGKMSFSQIFKEIPKTFFNFEAMNQMERVLEEIKPDVVHIHEIFNNLTPSVLLPCYKRKIPVIATLHTPRMSCPVGTLMKKENVYCEKELCSGGNAIHCVINKCRSANLPKSLIHALEYMFRRFTQIYYKADYFIAPSDGIRNLALKSGIKKEKLKVIYNFISGEYFENQPNYDNKGYFLFVGRLGKDKGVQYLIDAMTKVPKEIELHIVGEGPAEEEFKEICRKNNLDNVKFLGHKSGVELREEYKNCIASVVPSYWYEAFGLVIAEAFSFGKPVIGSNIGAIPELVEDGKTGFLVKPGSSQDIADKIQYLSDNIDLSREMGKNARQKAEKLYKPELHYNKLIEIYTQAIGKYK